ncbi:hypothetical protein GWC95_17315 [Sediminibacterium roseum]|uniref:Lipoprotein n=1 Tax=Sediminibacterium roseum TaxID=1978412 RepID=A0ABX0A167_9BACT|nr:hypothetical protein [Sediminibacterium roseum]NCI51687.1 hypothetical protein [Sediminibacterium roseum]
MKKLVLFSVTALVMLASCSKKTHPTVSKPTKKPEPVTTVSPKKDSPVVVAENPPVTTTPEPATEAPVFNSPLIVIDEAGKVITPGDKLPEEIALKVDYKKIAKGFSLEQRKNLIYRFKMVPPKVLFIPAEMSSKSARGTYIIYKKKFYYWRKDDGLFYLDETYYQ